MAKAGLGSRRGCEELIVEGRVQVNGQIATIGMSADPEVDDIRVNGERLAKPEKMAYYMLNKPRGVISDEDVAGNWPRARDLIPVGGHLYPVGRLDLHSEGLMLFTNDGDLAHQLTHPRYEHKKVYLVTVEGSPSNEVLQAWRRGVVLDERRTAPADVIRLRKSKEGVVLKVTIREGRKRQLRRVAALLGHPAVRLQRVQLASLGLGDLPPGSWRALSEEEVEALRKDVASKPARRPRSAPQTQGGRPSQPGSTIRSGQRPRAGSQTRRGTRPGNRPAAGDRPRRRTP